MPVPRGNNAYRCAGKSKGYVKSEKEKADTKNTEEGGKEITLLGPK